MGKNKNSPETTVPRVKSSTEKSEIKNHPRFKFASLQQTGKPHVSKEPSNIRR